MTMSMRTLYIVAVLAALVFVTGCQDDEPEFSCKELEQEEDVELLLCDDGDTRIDRRDELSPATPEAKRAD